MQYEMEKRNEFFADAQKSQVDSVVETCQNIPKKHQPYARNNTTCPKLPACSKLAHVGKLLVDGVAEENLPLAGKLHLQPLFREGNELLLCDSV